MQCTLQLQPCAPPTLCEQVAAEEVFEALALYFPIAFTPPPNDPHRITEQHLLQALLRALELSPTLVRGKSVLELGCGTGVVALACVDCGVWSEVRMVHGAWTGARGVEATAGCLAARAISPACCHP